MKKVARLIIDKAFCRTALATLGLLKREIDMAYIEFEHVSLVITG